MSCGCVCSAQAFSDMAGIRKDVSALATRTSSWVLSKGCLAPESGETLPQMLFRLSLSPLNYALPPGT